MERLCLVLFCIGVLVTCQTNVKTRNYNINFNKRMNSGIFGKHQRILSYHECAIYCQSVVNCWTANFHSIDNVCELSRDSPRTQPRNQVENPGWIVLHRNGKSETLGGLSCTDTVSRRSCEQKQLAVNLDGLSLKER